MKLSLAFFLLTGLVVAFAEPRIPQRGDIHEIPRGVAGPNPYIFLSVPQGRSQSIVQGFEVLEDDEDDEADEPTNLKQQNALLNEQNDDEEEDDDADDDDDNDDDDVEEENDDDDEVDNSEVATNANAIKNNGILKSGKPAQMMISRDHAGAILVPDEIVEIEGQSVIDEKTGKPSLLLPRSVLDAIPDGSVVALLEQPAEDRSEERANRVIVRRRRKGSRRRVKRRRVNNNRRRRRGGNRRRGTKRIRIVRVNSNRRRNVRRGNRRRVVYQG